MATTVTFYSTNDDPRVIGKTLHTVTVKSNCKIKGEINTLYPSFILKYDANVISDANYVGWNGKYYFIRDKTLDSAEQMTITCAIDVLQTYETDIKACNATCVRWQGENKPTFVIDKSLPIEENRSENVNVNFGNPFPLSTSLLSDRVVLITI